MGKRDFIDSRSYMQCLLQRAGSWLFFKCFLLKNAAFKHHFLGMKYEEIQTKMKHQQKYFACKEAEGNSVSEDALVVPHFLLANWALMLTSNTAMRRVLVS